ncbi:Os10g0359801, partial [Oryza sativa Japonica Group]
PPLPLLRPLHPRQAPPCHRQPQTTSPTLAPATDAPTQGFWALPARADFGQLYSFVVVLEMMAAAAAAPAMPGEASGTTSVATHARPAPPSTIASSSPSLHHAPCSPPPYRASPFPHLPLATSPLPHSLLSLRGARGLQSLARLAGRLSPFCRW